MSFADSNDQILINFIKMLMYSTALCCDIDVLNVRRIYYMNLAVYATSLFAHCTQCNTAQSHHDYLKIDSIK